MVQTRWIQQLYRLSIVGLLAAGMVGCKSDSTTSPSGGSSVVPITSNLFPVVLGHHYAYTGWATAPSSTASGARIPDPSNFYNATWTVGPMVPSPLGDGAAIVLVDSTHGPFGSGGSDTLIVRTLLARKDSATGDLYFLQTLGSFKRAVGVPVGTHAADTLVWVAVARPSQGVGSTGAQWTAYDSTFSSGGTTYRLQILGRIIEQTTVTDSSAAHATHTVYRSRTSRTITVGGLPVASDIETSQLWLEPDIGPVQVRITEDNESIGHWRFLTGRNF